MDMDRIIHYLDWEIWEPAKFERRVLELLRLNPKDATELDFLELFDAFRIMSDKKIVIKDRKIKSDVYQKLSQKYRNISAEEISKEFEAIFTYDKNDELRVDRHQFRNSFFKVFEEYKWHKIFKENDLKLILDAELITIRDLLETKYWSEHYNLVKEIFLSKPDNLELVLTNFTDSNIKYVFPSNISKEEYYDLAVRYVNGESESDLDANLNYLRLMQNGLTGLENFFHLDPVLKLTIQKEIERQTNAYFSDNEGYKQKYAVYGNWSEFIKEDSDNEIRGYVDVEFLKNHSDIPTLLNHAQYLYEFFNSNGIWNLVSFPNLESTEVFRAIFGIKSKYYYETSDTFFAKQWIILSELRMTRSVLIKEHHLELEDVFNYFFSEYSKQVLQLGWLSIEFSKSMSYGTKVSLMFIAEENLRKQWFSFTEHNEINRELVNLMPTLRIRELKSIVPNKYVYVHSEEMSKINHLLFSTQSGLSYINESLHENTFIKLLKNHSISYSDFEVYQLDDIDFLIKEDIITVRDNDEIFVTHQQEQFILICRFLWSYGVINYYNFPFSKVGDSATEYQNLINTKIEQGYLSTESTLFSKPEINYLNYLLNNSEYDNAKALRNKHNHSYVAEKDEDNLEDYLYAAAVIFVYIIKINEEFHLKNLLEGKEGIWMEQ